MTVLLPIIGATGLLLLLSGLPAFRGASLADRVEPYVSGLRGRPSALLDRASRPRTVLSRLLLRRMAPWIRHDKDLAARLRAAGDGRSPEFFRMEQLIWGFTGATAALAAFVALATLSKRIDIRALPLLTVLGGIMGVLGRDWFLQRQTKARRDLMEEQLPVAIDVLALAVMAGESIPAAFERTAAALKGTLAIELQEVVSDVRAGRPITEALEGFAARSDDPGIARLVDALCTGIERGAPLSDVLRAHAEDARDARRKRLIETAGRKEVLMLVPVVFLIMPVVVLFALYPGLVSLRLLVP